MKRRRHDEYKWDDLHQPGRPSAFYCCFWSCACAKDWFTVHVDGDEVALEQVAPFLDARRRRDQARPLASDESLAFYQVTPDGPSLLPPQTRVRDVARQRVLVRRLPRVQAPSVTVDASGGGPSARRGWDSKM